MVITDKGNPTTKVNERKSGGEEKSVDGANLFIAKNISLCSTDNVGSSD